RPARYRAAVLRDEEPARIKNPGLPPPAVDAQVWPPFYRRSHAVRTMVSDYLSKKVEQAVRAERQGWDRGVAGQGWERFRAQRIARLKTAAGAFPPPKPP